jgi:hypothetical protein
VDGYRWTGSFGTCSVDIRALSSRRFGLFATWPSRYMIRRTIIRQFEVMVAPVGSVATISAPRASDATKSALARLPRIYRSRRLNVGGHRTSRRRSVIRFNSGFRRCGEGAHAV